MPAPAVECNACPLCLANRGRCNFAQTRAAAGTLVFAQGEPMDRACFIREGLLTLSVFSAEGAERNFAVRGPRTLLGAESLNGGASAAEVRALTDVKLCVLSSSQFSAWLGPDHTPARAVLGFLLSELQHEQSDQDWRTGDCDSRVAKLALACEDAQVSNGFPVRQKQQMARLLGMRAETFSRSLRRLSEGGLIDAKSLRVRNREQLETLATGAEA